MEKEWGYIMLRMNDGTLVIFGGYNLHLDAEEGKLVVRNALVEIRMRPPINKDDILNTAREIREKFGEDVASKLSDLLKSIPELSLSD